MQCCRRARVVGAFGAPVATETVVEIRIHGNNSVPDEEVLELAGIAVGDFVDSAELDAVARRLATSGRFETVEVRKRYRSLTATDRIALVIVVRERPRRLDRLMSCSSCATRKATALPTVWASVSLTSLGRAVGSPFR